MPEPIESLPDEIWKPVPGYEGFYVVSSAGRVWSVRAERVMATHFVKGYRTVMFSVGNARSTIAVHRLVLEAFVGPRPRGHVACHNNGDARDNRAVNLRWDTPAANNADSARHGVAPCGERHGCAKLRAADVAAIRSSTMRSSELAQLYGVSRSTILRVRSGDRWRSVLPALPKEPQ